MLSTENNSTLIACETFLIEKNIRIIKKYNVN